MQIHSNDKFCIVTNDRSIYWILVDYLTEFVKSPYIQVTLNQYQCETCTLKSACEFKNALFTRV